MKKSFYISMFAIFLSLAMSSCVAGHKATKWMPGGWGVGFVMPTGGNADTEAFDINALAGQIGTLQTPEWVLVSLSGSLGAGRYSAPNPTLAAINPAMVPTRDLLRETIDVFHVQGKKVIVYFAAQGPKLRFFTSQHEQDVKTNQPELYAELKAIDASWSNYLATTGRLHHEGVADILTYYATSYDIDGWWLDHGFWGNYHEYIDAIQAVTPNVEIAWNDWQERKVFSHDDPRQAALPTKLGMKVTYTAGETRVVYGDITPWWAGNELMIKAIEQKSRINGAVAHMYIPLQSNWQWGPEQFPPAQASDWTSRVVNANGAITWAAQLTFPQFKNSSLDSKSFAVLQSIDTYILLNR